MKFSVRAMMAAMFLFALAAVSIRTDLVSIANLPALLWLAGVALGIFLTRGRGFRCIVWGTVGGILGATLAAASIAFFDQMSFTTWFAALMLIAMGGLGGAILSCVVRVIMEGMTLSLNRRPPKDHPS